MGEAFGKITGFFKAPKSGVYRFSFQMTLNPLEKVELVFNLSSHFEGHFIRRYGKSCKIDLAG